MSMHRFESIAFICCAVLFIGLIWVTARPASIQAFSKGQQSTANVSLSLPDLTPQWQVYQKRFEAMVATSAYQRVAATFRQRRQLEVLPLAQPKHPVVDCKMQACVALTFDDGPSIFTPQVLDILWQHDVKATFFVLGLYVQQYIPTMRRMAAEGHQIGNHTWHHRNLTALPLAEAQVEVAQTNTIIAQTTGKWPHVLRPPFGVTSAEVSAAIGMPQVLWSVDPYDWRDRDPNAITSQVLATVRQGDIVLLHDVYPSTILAIGPIVKHLKERGFQLVTVDQLIAGESQPALREYRRQPM